METENQPDLTVQQQEEEFLHVWSLVRRQVVSANAEQQQEQGISSTQFALFRFIGEAEEQHVPCTISWLAGHLNIDPASVVRSVDGLESRSLVQRRRATHDRRQVFVELTEQGRAIQHSLQNRYRSRLLTAFHAMSVQGRTALLEGLKEFVAVAQQQQE